MVLLIFRAIIVEWAQSGIIVSCLRLGSFCYNLHHYLINLGIFCKTFARICHFHLADVYVVWTPVEVVNNYVVFSENTKSLAKFL